MEVRKTLLREEVEGQGDARWIAYSASPFA